MNISLNLAFFPSAKSPQGKEKVTKAISSHLEERCQGLSVHWLDSSVKIPVCCESWELGVYEVIKICQSLGRQWMLNGNIDFEFSAWTNHPAIMGVESIEASVDKPA